MNINYYEYKYYNTIKLVLYNNNVIFILKQKNLHLFIMLQIRKYLNIQINLLFFTLNKYNIKIIYY